MRKVSYFLTMLLSSIPLVGFAADLTGTWKEAYDSGKASNDLVAIGPHQKGGIEPAPGYIVTVNTPVHYGDKITVQASSGQPKAVFWVCEGKCVTALEFLEKQIVPKHKNIGLFFNSAIVFDKNNIEHYAMGPRIGSSDRFEVAQEMRGPIYFPGTDEVKVAAISPKKLQVFEAALHDQPDIVRQYLSVEIFEGKKTIFFYFGGHAPT